MLILVALLTSSIVGLSLSFNSVFGGPVPGGGVDSNALACTPEEGGYITINGVRQQNKEYSVGGIPSGDLIAVPNSGYVFVKWLIYEDGGPYEYGNQTLPTSRRNDEASGKYECVFELSNYTVNVLTENEAMGTVTGGGNFSSDGTQSATITAVPKTGFSFDYWKNSAGTIVSRNSTYTFKVTAGDTYTAVFRAISIKIVSGSGGSEIASTKQSVNEISNEFVLTFLSGKYLSQIKFDGDSAARQIKYANGTFVDVAHCSAIEYVVNSAGSELYQKVINWHSDGDFNITLYFTNTTQSFIAGNGVGVDGIAVQTRLSGSASTLKCIGEARISGYSTTDGLNSVRVSALASSGFKFSHWELSDGTVYSSTYGDTTYLPLDEVKDKVIIAVFMPNSSNINSETENDDSFI